MSDEDTGSRRSLRQRISKTQPNPPKRRRSNKLEIPEETSIEDLYCQVNAKTNFNPTPLETIYESPKGKSQCLKDCMGMVKLKRHFLFTPFYNPSKCKIKMRKNKVKKLKRVSGNLNKSVTISLEQVEKVLQEISEDENEENQIPCSLEKKVENKECENHKQNLNYGSDLHNFDAYNSFMEVKEEKLSLHLNSESSSYEKQFEKFLELEDCNIFNSGTQESDKSKRERRRSRRVVPLCIKNSPVDVESVNEHSELRVSKDLDPKNQEYNKQNKLSGSLKSLDPVVQVESPSYSCIDVPCESSKLVSNNAVRTHGRKKSNKSRRNSGTNRSIYKMYIDCSFNDSNGNNEESPSSNSDNLVIKNTPSPTSLMDQLRIDSPEPFHCNHNVTKKGRRKSARLSVGKTENSSYGSLWTGTESTINDDKASEVVKSQKRSISNEINKCIESQFPSDGKGIYVTESLENHNVDRNNVDSPVLSGIFDCQARVSKDKTIKRKRGSTLSLSHFSFN